MQTSFRRAAALVAGSFFCTAALATNVQAQQASAAGPSTAPAERSVWEGHPFQQIAWDPALELPGAESLQKEILGPALEAAVAATGGLTVDEARPRIRVAVAQRPFQIGLSVNAAGLPEAKQRALGACYEALYRRIPGVLAARAQDLRREMVMEQEHRVDQRRAAVRQLEERQREFEQVLRKEAGLVDVTPDGVRASLGRLEQEKQRIALDLAGQKARQRAIEEAVANLSKRAEARVEQDPIAAELQKIVAAREKEIERLRVLVKDRAIAAAEVDAAGVALAEAKAKLLERRELAARREAGDLLDTLNRDLLMLSINSAEQSARLEFIEKSLSRFQDAVRVVDQIADLEREKKQGQAEVDEARVELLRRRMKLEEGGRGPAAAE